jgi:hypothetical protein
VNSLTVTVAIVAWAFLLGFFPIWEYLSPDTLDCAITSTLHVGVGR